MYLNQLQKSFTVFKPILLTNGLMQANTYRTLETTENTLSKKNQRLNQSNKSGIYNWDKTFWVCVNLRNI